MADQNTVANHYTQGGLLAAIRDGVSKLGKSSETVSVEDLGPVDEFHIGGRAATQHFLDQLDIGADDHVLDVGCGLGGASRFAAHTYGCRVTGVDLTPEFVETGQALSEWVGLGAQITAAVGNATKTTYTDGQFDKAFMLHVGMNISDKTALVRELYRVLKPGGTLGIYDIMRVGTEDLTYPVPWASSKGYCAVASPASYKSALTAQGFQIAAETNRRDFAVTFFDNLRAALATADGPPPLGLHILMGETAPLKVKNMVENVAQNRIAPVELIAKKP